MLTKTLRAPAQYLLLNTHSGQTEFPTWVTGFLPEEAAQVILVRMARNHGYNGRKLMRVESSYDSGCWRPGLAAKTGNMFFIWQEEAAYIWNHWLDAVKKLSRFRRRTGRRRRCNNLPPTFALHVTLGQQHSLSQTLYAMGKNYVTSL